MWYHVVYCIIRIVGMMITMLMMEAVSSSETLSIFYQTTWCNNPEEVIFIFIAMRT
jgi:hypothetical protein